MAGFQSSSHHLIALSEVMKKPKRGKSNIPTIGRRGFGLRVVPSDVRRVGVIVDEPRDGHKQGVKAVFSGHYHRNAGGCHDGLDMVVSSAIGCQLGEDTHGLRVVVVTADAVVHRYISLEQLSEEGVADDLRNLLQL